MLARITTQTTISKSSAAMATAAHTVQVLPTTDFKLMIFHLQSQLLCSQRITISLIHSACKLSMRRSGIFLRHSFIVAPLLSLNGVLGMTCFCRLLLNSDLLFLIAPTSQDMSNSEKTLSFHYRPKKHPLPEKPDCSGAGMACCSVGIGHIRKSGHNGRCCILSYRDAGTFTVPIALRP